MCGVIMGGIQLTNALLNTPSHILYCERNAARIAHSHLYGYRHGQHTLPDTTSPFTSLTWDLQMQIMMVLGVRIPLSSSSNINEVHG
jgi:hypothetical protein